VAKRRAAAEPGGRVRAAKAPARLKPRQAAPSFDAFARRAFDCLEAAGVDFLVIGGVAVVVLAEPRTTADVDVVVYGGAEAVERVLRAARRARFEFDPTEELESLNTTGTVRVRAGGFQLDVIAASLPFEDEALRRSQPIEIFGRTLPFPTAEDLLVFKLAAGRDKDMLDASGIARAHLETLDVPYVRHALAGLADLAEDHAVLLRLDAALTKAGLPPGRG
jgi:hypothetical protein